MNAKEYLHQVRFIDTVIDNKQKELEQLKDMAVSISSGPSDKESVQTSHDQDKLGDIVAKIIDTQDEINCQIDHLVDVKREVVRVMEKVKNVDAYKILYKRYIECKRWELIAVEMSYSIQWVYKIHGAALIEISKILKE